MPVAVDAERRLLHTEYFTHISRVFAENQHHVLVEAEGTQLCLQGLTWQLCSDKNLLDNKVWKYH